MRLWNDVLYLLLCKQNKFGINKEKDNSLGVTRSFTNTMSSVFGGARISDSKFRVYYTVTNLRES